MATAAEPLPSPAEPLPPKRRKPRSYDGVRMDIDEFLALPDDGADRWLLDGVVHEWLPATRERMTIRVVEHGEPEGAVVTLLRNWRKAGNHPVRAASGEIGIQLRPGEKTLAGADVVVWRNETPLTRRGKRGNIIAGVPLLVVEVLSDSDRAANIMEKVETYVAAGVPLVWIVDPFRKLVHVYRGSIQCLTLAVGDTLDGGAELPGFSAPVAEVFE